jgi:hypothetical protein
MTTSNFNLQDEIETLGWSVLHDLKVWILEKMAEVTTTLFEKHRSVY